MPLFDLMCKNCKHEFEQLLKASDVDENGNVNELKCPKCHKKLGFVKLLSTKTSFQLKGKNWANNGYGND